MADHHTDVSFLISKNIYRDSLNRLVLWNSRKKKAYLITKDDETKLSFYQYRILLAIALFIVLSVFGMQMVYAGMIAAAAFIVLQIMYMRFLTTLSPVKKFVPGIQKKLTVRMAEGFSRQKLIVRSLVFFAVGILVVVNGIYSHFEAAAMVIDYVILAGCIVIGILNLIASSQAER